MNLIVWIQNSHLTNKVFLHHLASCSNVSLCSVSGVQPALHFGEGAIFMKFHSMTPSCLFNRGTTSSQTVTVKVLFAAFPKMRTFQFKMQMQMQSRCKPND